MLKNDYSVFDYEPVLFNVTPKQVTKFICNNFAYFNNLDNSPVLNKFDGLEFVLLSKLEN